MSNLSKSKVKAVGTYRLRLDTGHYLDLHDVFYVPSVSRNLISLPKLDGLGYTFFFENSEFRMFKDSILVGNETLCDGLYKINVDCSFSENLSTMNVNVSVKRSMINENSSTL